MRYVTPQTAREVLQAVDSAAVTLDPWPTVQALARTVIAQDERIRQALRHTQRHEDWCGRLESDAGCNCRFGDIRRALQEQS